MLAALNLDIQLLLDKISKSWTLTTSKVMLACEELSVTSLGPWMSEKQSLCGSCILRRFQVCSERWLHLQIIGYSMPYQYAALDEVCDLFLYLREWFS